MSRAYFMIADVQHNTLALYLVNYNWWIHHKGYEQYKRDKRQTFRDTCFQSQKGKLCFKFVSNNIFSISIQSVKDLSAHRHIIGRLQQHSSFY